MRKLGVWFAYGAILFVLQSSFMPLLAINGVSVDFFLLLTVSFGFIKGPRRGVLAGFLLGLAQDLATGTFFGMNTLVKMTLGLICGKLADQVFKDQLFLPLSASVFAALANYLMLVFLYYLMGYGVDLPVHARHNLPQMIVIQFVFAYPLHKLTMWVDEYAKKTK